MSARRDTILREMGLAPLWRLRARTRGGKSAEPAQATVLPAARTIPPERAIPAAAGGERALRIAGMDWKELGDTVAACRACARSFSSR